MGTARFIDGSAATQLFERYFDQVLATLQDVLIAGRNGPDRVAHELPLEASRHGETHMRLLYMPGLYRGTIGFKTLAYPLPRSNRASTSQGLVVVFDADCAIRAVVDARALTSIRTAAVTGLACRYLAQEHVRRLGIIGYGLQGRAHGAVLSRLYPHATLTVYRADPTSARAPASSHKTTTVVAASTAAEAANAADILVTATSSKTPIFAPDWIHPGLLYCQIGGGDECGEDAVARFDHLVSDDWEQTRQEGHKSLARAHATGRLSARVTELRDVLTGRKQVRADDNHSMMLSCTGFAAEDIAVASLIASRAVDDDRGVPIDLTYVPFGS